MCHLLCQEDDNKTEKLGTFNQKKKKKKADSGEKKVCIRFGFVR